MVCGDGESVLEKYWDAKEVISTYYQVLGKLSSEFGVQRWLVESIIYIVFPSVLLYWGEKISSPLVIDLDAIMNIKWKELHSAVKRWARNPRGFIFFLEERSY